MEQAGEYVAPGVATGLSGALTVGSAVWAGGSCCCDGTAERSRSGWSMVGWACLCGGLDLGGLLRARLGRGLCGRFDLRGLLCGPLGLCGSAPGDVFGDAGFLCAAACHAFS